MNRIDFTDKVVIVTGASSGIGAESARALAKYGAKLSLVGRNKERLDKVAQDCHLINNLEALQILADLTQPGMCEYVITKTVESCGKIDVLINCAGGVISTSMFDQGMEVFDAMMAINLRVPYLLTQLVLPHLIKTKGNVVNVGSTLSSRHREGFIPYILAKSALQQFTEYAAAEVVTEGVRVNCINPGLTRTNILYNLRMEGQSQSMLHNIKDEHYSKIMDPKEVATLICLTASGVFPNLNGAWINLDGALIMS